jgi:TPR repeat protein
MPPDFEEAAKWFRLAAEQGEVLAERYLGTMYANGQGVARDDKEAVKWYARAAERGDAHAQASLAAMYSAARGTSQNFVQAHKWFTVAASRYPASERVKRAQAIRSSEQLAEKMSPSEVEAAKKLAREWQPKS